MAEELTNMEECLASQYVSVLDFVSRCTHAIECGDWYYLNDKAHQLEDATQNLARIAGEIEKEIRADGPRPRTAVVRGAVAHWGRHYRAARLLHPEHDAAGEGR